MRKKIFIFLLTTCSFVSKAQVTLMPQTPPAGTLMKSQLWNLIVVSPNDYSDAGIDLILSDAGSGEVVLAAATSGFNLSTGSNQFDAVSLPAITYNYLSPDFTDHNPDGFLIAGNYVACYNLNLNVHGTLIKECVPVTIEAVSPPMLNTPFNKEVLQTYTPQFTWIPPMPSEIYSFLNYDFKLVEVLEDQNPADAIQQNLAICSSSQTEPYLNYPVSANMLDTGKTYAWQIVAKNKNEYNVQSEIWTFTIASLPIVQKVLQGSSSLKLKKDLDGAIGSAVGSLNAYYLNEAEDSFVSYRIMSIGTDDRNVFAVIKSGSISLKRGENEIVIPFISSDNLKAGKTYLFQLINSRQEKWSVKFIYLKDNE